MNASSATAGLPFNPRMLRWAREWRGRAVEEAAQKIGVSEDKLVSWEDGVATPTVRQARTLASYYERPFLEFFLVHTPDVPDLQSVPDFRLQRGAPDPKGDREIQAIQSWAEDARRDALDLFSIMGEPPPKVPDEFQASLQSSPEKAAITAREVLDFPISQQLNLRSQDRVGVSKIIRRAIEKMGVLVLKDSDLGKYGVRGLTIYTETLPVVIFGTESPTAQSFTLAHELGHIALSQSAISGPPSARDAQTTAQKAEKWCDEFAAAFLVPASSLMGRWAKPNQPNAKIGDDLLRQLANDFSVSPHAMLIRLIHLGYVEPDYYWQIKRPQFLQEEAEYKGGGRAKYYGSRFRNAFGDLYTGLVLDAWGSGRITNHNAAELLGTKSLNHLFDIREYFLS